MSDVQKRRLATASEEALAKRRKLYMAYIVGSSPDRISENIQLMGEAEQRFSQLLATGGLMRGDLVRILADGPLKDVEGRIVEICPDGRIAVQCDGDDCVVESCALAMVAHAPKAKRPRKKEKEE